MVNNNDGERVAIVTWPVVPSVAGQWRHAAITGSSAQCQPPATTATLLSYPKMLRTTAAPLRATVARLVARRASYRGLMAPAARDMRWGYWCFSWPAKTYRVVGSSRHQILDYQGWPDPSWPAWYHVWPVMTRPGVRTWGISGHLEPKKSNWFTCGGPTFCSFLRELS